MTKLENSSLTPEVEAATDFLNRLLAQWQLPVSCSMFQTKKGTPLISFTSRMGQATVDVGALLQMIKNSKTSSFFRPVRDCFPGLESDVDTTDLLSRAEYSTSCLTEIGSLGHGNAVINRMLGMPADHIPVLYDSTSGLNVAEVFETIACAQTATDRGLNAYAVFGTTGHDNLRAKKMLSDSTQALPTSLLAEYTEFAQSLGSTPSDQRIQAALQLVGEFPLKFISADATFEAIDQNLSLAKIVLLSLLAGGQPLLFENSWRQFRGQDLIHKYTAPELSASASQFMEAQGATAAGFTWYARDAVIGADTPGSVIVPCKLTTHANIYKILGRYGSLHSQNSDRGVILCPITRHRIQTAEQARINNDPCDATVIAYLAQKFPSEAGRLLSDFADSCQVLTPAQAISAGTADRKFIIENYFPI